MIYGTRGYIKEESLDDLLDLEIKSNDLLSVEQLINGFYDFVAFLALEKFEIFSNFSLKIFTHAKYFQIVIESSKHS